MKYDFYIVGTIGLDYDWCTGSRGTTAEMVRNFLSAHKDKELTIAVSSMGGYISEGLAIMEYIKAHGKCNMVIIGMTASAATVLCMKAKSVKIARGSMMLIHNSSKMLELWTSASKEDIDAIIRKFRHEREQLDTIDKCIADIYTQKNGKTLEENLAMMSKEKWISAQGAKDFGLVDAVIDDEEDFVKAKSVKNAYAGVACAADHFCIPQVDVEKGVSRSLLQRVRENLKNIYGVLNDEEKQQQTINSLYNMNKTFIKVNNLLKVEGFKETTDGVVLAVSQLQVIENYLAEVQGAVEKLGTVESQLVQARKDKETADAAKDAAERELASLKENFEKFKAEAGDYTSHKPASGNNGNDIVSSGEMFNQIKSIL